AAPPDRRADQTLIGRVQVELGPPCASERPRLLVSLDEFLAGMTHLELDSRLLLPPGVFAFQEMAEELLLERDAIVRVEVRPVLDAVDLEPFQLGRRAHEPLEVAPRVEPLPAPVGRREERNADLRPVRHPRAPVLVAGQRVLPAVLVEVA